MNPVPHDSPLSSSEGTKQCSVCGLSKPLRAFYATESGCREYCILCFRNPIERPCAFCRNPVSIKPALIERKKYCSVACARAGRKGKRNSKATEFKKGQVAPNYNGGRFKTRGYILILRPDHPRTNPNGYVAEHIVVWEEHHGRPLPEGWCVHHINGVKDDNRIENLCAMPRKAHHPALDPGYIKARLREIEEELERVKQENESLRTKLRRLQGRT